MRVLGHKSPIRKVRGPASTAESDSEYVPSKTQASTYRSATPTRYSEARPVSLQRHSEDYGSEEIPSRDPQAAIHVKAEYFNSKFGPSAQQEEPTLRSYPMQESPYGPTRRNDESSAGHKWKDNHDTRQGHSKKGKGKYGRNDHRAPLPNLDRAQEVFTLLNTTYEAVLMNEHKIIPKPNHRKPNRQDNRDTGKFCRYHQHNSHNTEECWISILLDHRRHRSRTQIDR
ncbi:unnamed protein product [Prunus brigantina]